MNFQLRQGLKQPDWTPNRLFADGTVGCWFDVADLSIIFQDATGSVAGAVNSPVGRILDKSKNLSRGLELIPNGSFDSALNWIRGAGHSIGSGTLNMDSAADGSVTYQEMSLVPGKSYIVTYLVTSLASGAVRVKVGSSGNGVNHTAVGTYTEIITCVGDTNFYVRASGGGTATTCSVDNISVRELAGNHATQSADNSRPVLRNGFLDYDGINDVLQVSLPASSTATVVYVSTAGVRVATNQTTGTNYNLPAVDWVSCLVVNRALTQNELTNLRRYLRRTAKLTNRTSNPFAAAKAQDVLDFMTTLANGSANRIISGQQTYMTDSLIDNIFTATGKYPGLVGIDYYYQNNETTNNQVTAWANSGSIIKILHHWNNPLGGNAWNLANVVDFTQLITEDTALNTTFKGYLDAVANGMAVLQTNNVAVLYSPFHEMNGNWFWWGNKNPEEFKAVWRYMFNYMHKKGIHNILWTYAANANIGNELDYYPGSQYVDVVGVDLYGGVNVSTVTNYNALVALGKPFGLTEYGPGAPSGIVTPVDWSGFITTLKANMPSACFWMNWGQSFSMEYNTGTSTVLNDPWVVTRDEMPTL
jgi:beta-mannanase